MKTLKFERSRTFLQNYLESNQTFSLENKLLLKHASFSKIIFPKVEIQEINIVRWCKRPVRQSEKLYFLFGLRA